MAKRFGVMLDMSRNAVMRVEEVKKYADMVKSFGYNMIMLYTEDTYEIEGEPYFGYLRGRYSKDELKEIVSYCNSIGIEVIPCIQTLAHLHQIFKWQEYSKTNDVNDILLVGSERTYELIENMFKSIKECFTSDIVHIGMDEAHMLGLGKYLDKNGYKNRFDILRSHLERVIDIAKKYAFKPIMWSDMFFRLANKGAYYIEDVSVISNEVIAACPEGVDQVYWDYYSEKKSRYDVMLDAHKKFPGETWFAGAAWTWRGFAPNNEWTIESMSSAMASCKERNVENIMMTMWGDDGKECSFWSLLPSLYAVKKIYEGETDMEKIKIDFAKVTGESFDDMMLLDMKIDVGRRKRMDNSYNKYLLYSDTFLGYIDPVIKRSYRDDYLELSKKLEAAAKGSNFSYLYASHAALSLALAYKHDLGVRTREAYKANDKGLLDSVIHDYERAIEATEKFALAFRTLWFSENKPHGFDVQELRLGGLILRLKSQKDRLESYLAEKNDVIEELEEELLPYNGIGADAEVDSPCITTWERAASPNRIVY